MTNPRELRELQKHWYSILRNHGFEDIEEFKGDELVLKQSAAHNFCSVDPFHKEMKEEYFILIFHKVNDETTFYKTKEDKMIMNLHANGSRIKDIIETLKSHNMYRCRRHIRTIIRQYIMAWDIKHYTPEQLNKYPRKKAYD